MRREIWDHHIHDDASHQIIDEIEIAEKKYIMRMIAIKKEYSSLGMNRLRNKNI